jgi:hypothetical protein
MLCGEGFRVHFTSSSFESTKQKRPNRLFNTGLVGRDSRRDRCRLLQSATTVERKEENNKATMAPNDYDDELDDEDDDSVDEVVVAKKRGGKKWKGESSIPAGSW